MYALIIERLERHVLNERHVAAVFRVNGSKKADAPTFEKERARLDRVLGQDDNGRRRARDPEQQQLIAALGLGR